MISIERTVEITDFGAIVHKSLVTPFFYKRLKPARFKLERGGFRYITGYCSIALVLIPYLEAYSCPLSIATHEGERWIAGNEPLKDFNFLKAMHPKEISKITKRKSVSAIFSRRFDRSKIQANDKR